MGAKWISGKNFSQTKLNFCVNQSENTTLKKNIASVNPIWIESLYLPPSPSPSPSPVLRQKRIKFNFFSPFHFNFFSFSLLLFCFFLFFLFAFNIQISIEWSFWDSSLLNLQISIKTVTSEYFLFRFIYYCLSHLPIHEFNYNKRLRLSQIMSNFFFHFFFFSFFFFLFLGS